MISTRMTRILVTCILVLAVAFISRHDCATVLSPAPAFAQNSTSQNPPLSPKKSAPANEEDQDRPRGQTAISVAVDLVSLQVLVTDQSGNAVTGLKPENFTIYEDNVKQDISNFSAIEANITVVALVEYSNNVSRFLYEIWNALFYFSKSLRKDDWVAVMGYDMHTTILCDFTQNRQQLQEALQRFMMPAYHESNLSDAVIEALDRTQEIDGKVAVILISTGLDTFSRHTYDDALKKCKEANASIYAIGLGQRYRILAEATGRISNEASAELAMADNRLRSFADLSGGAAYFPRMESELPSIFGNISELLRNQYSIAYASSNTKKDGKFRKIRVDVSADLKDAKGKPLKLKVITRKGYIAKES
jgi:VWFA-related protein